MKKLNKLGIQLLSQSISKHLFKSIEKHDHLSLSKWSLQRFGLLDKNLTEKDVEFPIPEVGQLGTFLYNLGRDQSDFVYSTAGDFKIPPKPIEFSTTRGWTRYHDGSSEAVEYPLEDILVFDTEVMYKISPYPVMAVAVSPTCWYSWTGNGQELIKMGKSKKIIIGHHVSYDRARIYEEYYLEKSPLEFIDTLSLHCSVGGLSSQQRPDFMKVRDSLDAYQDSWETKGTTNSLSSIAQFYLKKEMDKSTRDYFSSTSMDILKDPSMVQKLLQYCAEDVQVTAELFQVLFPKFKEKCPHPISLAGMLHMATGYLPTDLTWHEYIKSASAKYSENQEKIEKCLKSIINDILTMNVNDAMKDPWLRNLDWDVKPTRMTKEKVTKKGIIPARLVASQNPALIGKPNWYRSLWDSKESDVKITLSKSITPLLLKLEWEGHPIVKSKKYGWLYHKPTTLFSHELKKSIPPEAIMNDLGELYLPDRLYFKIPHPGGASQNCGTPLSKTFMNAFEEDLLASSIPKAKELLKLHGQGTYWSSRDRITSQMVVDDKSGEFTGCKSGSVIIPLIVPMGTVTRRATESTWLTASNAKKNSIGSELKAKIKAPPGFKIVGADVDSQELWIASLLGDSQFGLHGATPLGFMTLQGSKSQGTDLHSVTAKLVGISRDVAKIFNYSRIYGAGEKYAAEIMMKHVPNITLKEATLKVKELYKNTKGQRITLNSKDPFWHGGMESVMFNQLEKIARSDNSRTPVLDCEIPNALQAIVTKNKFLTSRINWVVQSSGVDYLHILLVSMEYLMKRMKIRGRFMISIHDEIRFIIRDEDVDKACLALQISNLWTRSYFAIRTGFHDIPQNVAFFSAVDVDHVLRKEVYMDCVTPSNTTPIAPGSTQDIHQTVERNFKDKRGDVYKSIYGEEVLRSKVECDEKWNRKSDVLQAVSKTELIEQLAPTPEDVKAQRLPSPKGSEESKPTKSVGHGNFADLIVEDKIPVKIPKPPPPIPAVKRKSTFQPQPINSNNK